MKKILLLIGFLAVTKLSYAVLETSFDYSEDSIVSNKKIIDSIHIYNLSKTMEVKFRKGYYKEGKFVSTGDAGNIIFKDNEDSENANYEFTDAIINILNSNNLHKLIENKVNC